MSQKKNYVEVEMVSRQLLAIFGNEARPEKSSVCETLFLSLACQGKSLEEQRSVLEKGAESSMRLEDKIKFLGWHIQLLKKCGKDFAKELSEAQKLPLIPEMQNWLEKITGHSTKRTEAPEGQRPDSLKKVRHKR